MKRTMLLITALAVLTWSNARSADPAGRNDFAYGFDLQTSAPAEFYIVPVTLPVYRAVTDPQLRDTGVFNAAGQAVPRLFEHPDEQASPVETLSALTLVPLYGEEDEQSEQLRLMLRSDTLGTTVRLDASPAREKPATERTPAAYIVDLDGLDDPVQALEFGWPDTTEGFIGEVRIDHGDDLRQWRRLATATLADLRSGDFHIEQRRVRLSRNPARFLRISWGGLPRAWQFVSLGAVHSGPDAETPREWLSLERVPGSETERELLFDAQAYLPVDRVQLNLPEGNVVLHVRVEFRDQDDAHWYTAHSGVFYRWSDGTAAVQSPPVDFDRVRARYWRLFVESGLLDGPVQLQLGWQPDRLLFLAQGPGPFELAAGRVRDAVDGFPQERRLGDPELFRALRAEREPGAAVLGARHELGGAERLVAEPGKPGRLTLLWLGLIGAVALVAWLAWSLLREMGKEQGLGTRD